MHFTDFIKLTQPEIIKHTQLLTYLGQYEHENVISLKSTLLMEFKKTDVTILIKLATTNPIIHQLCQDPELTSHWETIWRSCGLSDELDFNNNMPSNNGFLPIPTIHTFDLISGTYFYWLYKAENNDSSPDAHEYLHQSVLFGCFEAIYRYCHQQLDELQQAFSNDKMAELIKLAKKSAEQHGTPGYLLLADVYYSLSKHIKSQQRHLMSVGVGADFYLKLADESLQMADQLENTSQAQIHNANCCRLISDLDEVKVKIRSASSSNAPNKDLQRLIVSNNL